METENPTPSSEESQQEGTSATSSISGAVIESTPAPAAGTPGPAKPTTDEVKPAVGQPKPKKSFGSKLLTWLVVAAVFFLAGMVTFYFTRYQPLKIAADKAAADGSAKISSLTADFNQALKQYRDAQTELDLTKGELKSFQATEEELQNEVATIQKTNITYKFLVDVSSARLALEKEDVSGARQAINFARADLKALEATDIEKDALSGFAEKLDAASSNLSLTGMESAKAALDELYANLLLLVDHLIR
jgi:hypothetical protein